MLIQHAFRLAFKERPPDQKLTDDEHVRIGKQLREAWLPLCERMTTDGYNCAMGATTLVEIEACGK